MRNPRTARLILAAALALSCGESPRTTSRCPDCNVLLITIDTLRPDHMSLYGYERETTPALDRFFENRAVFGNATSSAPCTVPAVKQLLTGDFEAEGPRLAERLAAAGYQTAAVVSQHIFRWRGEIDAYRAGFQHWDLQAPDRIDHHSLSNRSAAEVSNRALSWLEAHAREAPFFLWLHYFDPHDPYAPPRDFRLWHAEGARFSDGDRRLHLQTGRSRISRWQEAGDRFSDADTAHFIALYDGEIRYTDHQLGRVLDALAQLELPRETLVVLTADHGEHLGEGRLWDHCVTVRQVETRVPLALSLPSASLPREYLRRAPVSTLDIHPTILELLGLPAASGSREGRSLLATADGRRAIASFRGEVAIQDGRYKLVAAREGEHYQPTALYDLDADPGEARDRLGERPDLAARLFADLAAYLDLVDARERADAEVLEQLRALGYTD